MFYQQVDTFCHRNKVNLLFRLSKMTEYEEKRSTFDQFMNKF